MVDYKKVNFFFTNKDTSDFKLFKPFHSQLKNKTIKAKKEECLERHIYVYTHTFLLLLHGNIMNQCLFRMTHFVISFYSSQPHSQLEAEKVICPN